MHDSWRWFPIMYQYLPWECFHYLWPEDGAHFVTALLVWTMYEVMYVQDNQNISSEDLLKVIWAMMTSWWQTMSWLFSALVKRLFSPVIPQLIMRLSSFMFEAGAAVSYIDVLSLGILVWSCQNDIWVGNNHIFGIPDPKLPIHCTTFRGPLWRLRVVYWWVSPL